MAKSYLPPLQGEMSQSARKGGRQVTTKSVCQAGNPLCPRVKPGAGFRHLPRKGGEGEVEHLSPRGERAIAT